MADKLINNELNNKKVKAPGFNKLVYSKNFLTFMKKQLRQKVEAKGVLNTVVPPVEGGGFYYERSILVNSIAELMIEYSSPLTRYDNSVDYHRKMLCQSFLKNITVSMLILVSADNPF